MVNGSKHGIRVSGLHAAVVLTLVAGMTVGISACVEVDDSLEDLADLRDAPQRDIWNDEVEVGASSAEPQYWPSDLSPDALRAEIPPEEAKAFADIWGTSEDDAAARLAFERENVILAERLTLETSAGFAGVHLRREDGALVVSVTDRATARDLERIREAGAIARRVRYDVQELEAVVSRLKAANDDIQAGMGIDFEANAVSLTVPRDDQRPVVDEFVELASQFEDRVEVRFGDVEPVPTALWGGYEGTDVWAGMYTCSIAFLARNPVNFVVYALTAGHCGEHPVIDKKAMTWWEADGGSTIGPWVNDGTWPTSDYAAIHVLSPMSAPAARVRFGPNPPFNGGSEQINGSANVVQNQGLCKSGRTSGTTCGQVTNTSYDFAPGYMQNVIRTSIPVAGGDSGGALHVAGIGYGIGSGHTPNENPYRSHFQPIGPVIGPWGLGLGW